MQTYAQPVAGLAAERHSQVLFQLSNTYAHTKLLRYQSKTSCSVKQSHKKSPLTLLTLCHAVFGISLLLVGLISPVSAADLPSCTTSSDLEGQPASVTCHFPQDISVSRDHFRFYKYDFDRQHYLPGKWISCLVASSSC